MSGWGLVWEGSGMSEKEIQDVLSWNKGWMMTNSERFNDLRNSETIEVMCSNRHCMTGKKHDFYFYKGLGLSTIILVRRIKNA